MERYLLIQGDAIWRNKGALKVSMYVSRHNRVGWGVWGRFNNSTPFFFVFITSLTSVNRLVWGRSAGPLIEIMKGCLNSAGRLGAMIIWFLMSARMIWTQECVYSVFYFSNHFYTSVMLSGHPFPAKCTRTRYIHICWMSRFLSEREEWWGGREMQRHHSSFFLLFKGPAPRLSHWVRHWNVKAIISNYTGRGYV